MSSSQGSHRAVRRHRRVPVAPPGPVPAPRYAASVHEQLTVIAVMRPAGPATHDPTLVDTVLPHRPRAPRRAADRRHRSGSGRQRLRRLLPQALILAFLTGGTWAFLAHDKAVTLDVDGQPRTLHTFADDVGELLAEEEVTVGADDLVAPAPGSGLDHGDEVAVRRSAQRGALP